MDAETRRAFEKLQRTVNYLVGLATVTLIQEDRMSQELDDLTAEVARNTSLEQSAITLIEGLAAKIAAAGTDPVALKALTTSLTGSADALAAAIVANTPATP